MLVDLQEHYSCFELELEMEHYSCFELELGMEHYSCWMENHSCHLVG